jgi:hypothetical protein
MTTSSQGGTVNLAELFAAIADQAEADREQLNTLDARNNNAGDNMAANMRLVSQTISQYQARGSSADEALQYAAQTLRAQGQGRTAAIYAAGLEDAAQKVVGQQSLSLGDLAPLLDGLLGGAQRSSGAQQGDGTLLDALIPGVLAYMQAKRAGRSETEAILEALLNAQRGGGFGGRGAPQGYPPDTGRGQPAPGPLGGLGDILDGLAGQGAPPAPAPRRPIDPGAAGVGSLLEGILRALGNANAGRGNSSSGTPTSSGGSGGLGDLLGGLLGGNDDPSPNQGTRSHRRD